MNYFTDQYHHPAKKKTKKPRPNSLADLQGAEAPRSLIKPVASQPGGFVCRSARG